jgi:hypothetical protein
MRILLSLLIAVCIPATLLAQSSSIWLTSATNVDSLTAMQGDEVEIKVWVNTATESITGFQCFLSFDETIVEAVPYDQSATGLWYDYQFFDGIVIFADDHDSRIAELPGLQLDWCIQTGIGNPRPAYPVYGCICKIKLRLLQPVEELEIAFDHDWSNFRNTIYWQEGSDAESSFDNEHGLRLTILENSSLDPNYSQPQDIRLSAPWPNPFNASCNLTFFLPVADRVRLEMYDISGRIVNRHQTGSLPGGWHLYNFTAEGLSSGVYFFFLSTGGQQLHTRATLIK